MKVVYIILVKEVKKDMLIKEVTKSRILDRVEWWRQIHVIEYELIMTILNWNRTIKVHFSVLPKITLLSN